jgi:hypothetical protein
MRKVVVGLILVLALLGVAGCGGNSKVDVPINLEAATNVGSLHLELTYDTTVLQAVGVKSGELAEKATIESNLENQGKVIIGIIDANGISGDGVVATVSFNIIGDGTSNLALDNVNAYDANTLQDLATEVSSGNFVRADSSVTSPTIIIRGNQQ